MTQGALHARLDAGARFDAEYSEGLANHLPMALIALHRLGASSQRLDAFAATYRRLVPAAAPAQWIAADPWQARFGERAAWPAYRALFAGWLFREGRETVLAKALPALMSGCGAAAFHGLIRAAYAVDAGHDGELADGLAYWACRYMALDGGDATDPRSGVDLEGNPETVLNALRQQPVALQPRRGLIAERMMEAAQQPGFAAGVQRLRIDRDTLPALARLALRLYTGSGDFTVLHLVTSAHALRQLLPYLEAPLPAVRSYWTAYAAGAASVPSLPLWDDRSIASSPADALEWPDIIEHALASDDEHVIKLVHSCREEHRLYGWDEYRRAAARAAASK